jgi:hypothetical protein
MSEKNNDSQEKVEIELTEDALEQVSGGFNPQPDPPAKLRLDKVYQQLSHGPLLPAVQVPEKKV